jgi:hypothetical protein
MAAQAPLCGCVFTTTRGPRGTAPSMQVDNTSIALAFTHGRLSCVRLVSSLGVTWFNRLDAWLNKITLVYGDPIIMMVQLYACCTCTCIYKHKSLRACLGISGMNGNEGHWGGVISTVSQNFPKSPSILFHPLESSISQTSRTGNFLLPSWSASSLAVSCVSNYASTFSNSSATSCWARSQLASPTTTISRPRLRIICN